MEQAITLDKWIVLCVAPCVIAWLLGQFYGTWKGRRLDADREAVAPLARPLMFAAPPLHRRRARYPAAPIDRLARLAQSDYVRAANTPHDQAAYNQRGCRAGGAHSEPTFADESFAAGALKDYRYSIAALRQSGREHSMIAAYPVHRDSEQIYPELLRITDLAPVPPHMRASELAARREARPGAV